MRQHLTTRILSWVTIGLITLGMTLPLASLLVPIPRVSLNGLKLEYELPTWSFKAFKKGKLQKHVEMWAMRGHPLWSWSVRTMNQMTYTLAGEVSLDYGTSVQGGKDGYLWQPMYLRALNNNTPPPQKKIYATFRALRRAQDILKPHGIPVIGVINPNLLALYPDLLPQKYLNVQNNESSYSASLRAIERFDPKIVNVFEILKNSKSSFPVRFFEPTGSHWNDVGSCVAIREVGRELGAFWGEDIPEPQCESYRMRFPPEPAERDLVEIANLLDEASLYKPAPYVIDRPRFVGKKPRRILLVGTSFLFALEKKLLRSGVADSTTLLFYFRQSRTNGTGSFHSLDKRNLTREEVLSYDAIIVDANVAGPGIMGYGFLQFVNALFDPSEAKNDESTPKVKKQPHHAAR
jgi:hypothetical protein